MILGPIYRSPSSPKQRNLCESVHDLHGNLEFTSKRRPEDYTIHEKSRFEKMGKDKQDNKSADKGTGGKAGKGKEKEKESKPKGASSINVRHILVRPALNPSSSRVILKR